MPSESGRAWHHACRDVRYWIPSFPSSCINIAQGWGGLHRHICQTSLQEITARNLLCLIYSYPWTASAKQRCPHFAHSPASLISAAMRLLCTLQTVTVAFLCTAVTAQDVIDLSTLEWTLSSPVYNISVPGRVPSQVHLDLYREGIIPDPYFGLGDFELRWVTLTNWTYNTILYGLWVDYLYFYLTSGLLLYQEPCQGTRPATWQELRKFRTFSNFVYTTELS